jgi:hypothetical protein
MTFNDIPDTDEGLAPPLHPRPVPPADAGYTQPGLIEATAQAEAMQLPPSATGDPETFLVAAMDYLRARLARAAEAGESVTGLVVLVQAEYPRQEGEEREMERIRGFKFSQTVELAGRVLVVSGSLSDAYAAPLQCNDVGAAFDELSNIRLATRPALLVDLGARNAVWCPFGTDQEESAQPLSLEPEVRTETPTLEAIRESIDRFHANWTRMPEAHAGVWHDEPEFVPALGVENRIQAMLFPVLWERFRSSHVVRREDSGVPGLPALSLTGRAVDAGRDVSVVGIGVVSSIQPTTRVGEPPRAVGAEESVRAIEHDIDGAVWYREEFGCSATLVCLFDMQREDDGGRLIGTLREAAAARYVELHRYLVPNRARPASDEPLSGRQN